MILPATEILYQWSLHAVNDSKWRKKREAHACTLSGSMGISYCSSLISIKTQTHASSKTCRDYFNASNKYSSIILREKSKRVLYQFKLGCVFFKVQPSSCMACIEIIENFSNLGCPIIYRNYLNRYMYHFYENVNWRVNILCMGFYILFVWRRLCWNYRNLMGFRFKPM